MLHFDFIKYINTSRHYNKNKYFSTQKHEYVVAIHLISNLPSFPKLRFKRQDLNLITKSYLSYNKSVSVILQTPKER